MWRELKGLGLNSCVALRRLIGKRLQFAREHLDWTLEQWMKVMWSDESRFTLIDKKWGQLTTWIHCMTRFPSMDFSSPMAYSKMKMPRIIGLKLWESGSVIMRHNFHEWIGHHRVQTITLLRISGMCWRRLHTAAWLPSLIQDLCED